MGACATTAGPRMAQATGHRGADCDPLHAAPNGPETPPRHGWYQATRDQAPPPTPIPIVWLSPQGRGAPETCQSKNSKRRPGGPVGWDYPDGIPIGGEAPRKLAKVKIQSKAKQNKSNQSCKAMNEGSPAARFVKTASKNTR
jgi:hypothetical protein